MDVSGGHDEYCRAIEAYLCRKNDGHLIRIVGPAFERVLDWAGQGVPLKVAYRGIDRYFERYYAKGARRRPVRVEFCEGDILDVFDEWRRAVGVSVVRETRATDEPGHAELSEGEGTDARSRSSLRMHVTRVLARLAAIPREHDALRDALRPTVETLTAMMDGGTLRGEARAAAIDTLRRLDVEVLEVARRQLDAAAVADLAAEADGELEPFRARMPADAYEQSRLACLDRLVRERFHLPVLAFE